MSENLLWPVLGVAILGMLSLDFLIFHRRAHRVSLKEGIIWTLIWIFLALLFNLGVYYVVGKEKALQFLTGFLIEKSLSMDNLFVFIMLFSYFNTPSMYQHRVLFWGILGALIMRGIFIFAGITLINMFHWTIYLLGAFLIFTGLKMGFQKEREYHPEKNPVLKLFRRFFPVTQDYCEQKFFKKISNKWMATPLFIVLLTIETTDIMFAVDSVPAVLAISNDPLIVYSSNIFAICGLRTLYFVLAEFMQLFRYLQHGLSIILVFIGIKMTISDLYKIPVEISLLVVAGIITASVLISVIELRLKNNSLKNS